MSDVLQTAMKYRNRLRGELGKVEEFLRMAEELSKETDPEARLTFAKLGTPHAGHGAMPGAPHGAPQERPMANRPPQTGKGVAAA